MKKVFTKLGTTFIYEGEEIPCSPSTASDATTVEDDSMIVLDDYDLNLTTLKSYFTDKGMALPLENAGQYVIVSHKEMRIDRITQKEGDPQIILSLNRPTGESE